MRDEHNKTRAAVRDLTSAGWLVPAIAEALGITPRMVRRYRAEMRGDALKVIRDARDLAVARERAG